MLLFRPATKQERLIGIRRSCGALSCELLGHVVASEELCRGCLRGITLVEQSSIDIIVQVYAYLVADLADLA